MKFASSEIFSLDKNFGAHVFLRKHSEKYYLSQFLFLNRYVFASSCKGLSVGITSVNNYTLF